MLVAFQKLIHSRLQIGQYNVLANCIQQVALIRMKC